MQPLMIYRVKIGQYRQIHERSNYSIEIRPVMQTTLINTASQLVTHMSDSSWNFLNAISLLLYMGMSWVADLAGEAGWLIRVPSAVLILALAFFNIAKGIARLRNSNESKEDDKS